MCTVYKKCFRFPEVASSMRIVCYPSQGAKVFQPQFHRWMNARYEATTVGREMWITYNAVCIIIHQGLENVETFSSRPRPRPRLFLQDQDQDQDFYFKTKTKTKTIFHVLEAPRDQDQGLETTSLPICYRHLKLERWKLQYSGAAVLKNVNAHKELQPNCKTYCRKLFTTAK